MCGHISVEANPHAKRVVEAYFPDAAFHDDVITVDSDMVKSRALGYSNAAVIILGAGPPCQGVSGLNADKRGALKDHRSKLFAEVPRIRDMVVKEFFWAQVHTLMESVASMDIKDRNIMSEAINLQPWRIDSVGMALCRRPRLYWVTWELQESEGVRLTPPDENWDYGEVDLKAQVPSEKFIRQGWKLAGDSLPTFTTARPSPIPGRKPAGLETCTHEEQARWREDDHRFPLTSTSTMLVWLERKINGVSLM